MQDWLSRLGRATEIFSFKNRVEHFGGNRGVRNSHKWNTVEVSGVRFRVSKSELRSKISDLRHSEIRLFHSKCRSFACRNPGCRNSGPGMIVNIYSIDKYSVILNSEHILEFVF